MGGIGIINSWIMLFVSYLYNNEINVYSFVEFFFLRIKDVFNILIFG